MSYSLAFVSANNPVVVESDAQSTIDETESCGASMLDEVTSIMAREFKEVKALQSSNQEEVIGVMTRELKEVKIMLNLLTSTQERPCVNEEESSRHPLVSALVCEFISSHSTLVSLRITAIT